MFDLGFKYPALQVVHFWTFVGSAWSVRHEARSADAIDRIDATWWLGSDVLEVIGLMGEDPFEMILPTAF